MSNSKGFARWKPNKVTQLYWLYRLMSKKGWLKVDEYSRPRSDKGKQHLCTPGKNLNNILIRGRRARLIPWEAVLGSRSVELQAPTIHLKFY